MGPKQGGMIMVKKIAFLAILGFGFALLVSGCQTPGHSHGNKATCCSADTKACCAGKAEAKATCGKDGKKACSAGKTEAKAACGKDCKKACCAGKTEAKAACGKDCKKACCAGKAEAKAACRGCGAEKGSAACKTKCAKT